jgi:hypothetical protein
MVTGFSILETWNLQPETLSLFLPNEQSESLQFLHKR